MIGTVTGARAVIAATVLILGVSACSSDDPEPIVAPTPSASEPSDPTTSPVAGALGPEETLAAWIDARNQALQDGDVSAVEALSAESCKTCRDSIAPIKQVYGDGGHFDTDGWVLVSSRLKSEKASKASLTAAIDYAAGKTVVKAGAEPVTYAVEHHIIIVDLIKEDGVWLVQFIGYLS
ncbi:DUF6318 family protein [Nocardioides caricicola]|uniref:DUF6318 family protein n=1 Tax=Nocardioides caricicola TaxID=634770 RepID=A0ABW0N236_9ACTN